MEFFVNRSVMASIIAAFSTAFAFTAAVSEVLGTLELPIAGLVIPNVIENVGFDSAVTVGNALDAGFTVNREFSALTDATSTAWHLASPIAQYASKRQGVRKVPGEGSSK